MNLISNRCPNQLVQNGNFASTSGWSAYDCSHAVNSNVLTITLNAAYAETYRPLAYAAHKYLAIATVNQSESGRIQIVENGGGTGQIRVRCETINTWTVISSYFTGNPGAGNPRFSIVCQNKAVGNTVQVKNAMCIDLTELYGTGNEPSSVAEFKADFPLDYYPYRVASATELLMSNNALVGIE